MAIDFNTIHQALHTESAASAQARSPLPGAEEVSRGEVKGFVAETQPDLSAMLTDSLEEISSMFEETEVKSMSDREIGDKRKKEDRFVSRVRFWTNKLSDMPNSDVIARLLRKLRNIGMTASHQQLMEMLDDASPDVTHQFAMLECLEEALGDEEADAPLLTMVKQARQELERTRGPEIRVGINLAEMLDEYGASPDEMQEKRDLYRGEIIGFDTPQTCFKSLLAKQGAEKLSAAIDFLIEACTVDMTSTTPSTQPEELRRIIVDLQSVEVLKTVLERFDKLGQRMTTMYNESPAMDGEAMTGKVLDMTNQNFLNGESIKAFVHSVRLMALAARLDFTRELSALIRSMSLRCFPDIDSRFRMIDSTQEYLDELVAEDEQNQEKEDESKEKLVL